MAPTSKSNTPAAVKARSYYQSKLNIPCNTCGKLFSCNFNLAQHVRGAHTNVRPYQCHCGKSYTRQWALNRHMTSAHPGAKTVTRPTKGQSAKIEKSRLRKSKTIKTPAAADIGIVGSVESPRTLRARKAPIFYGPVESPDNSDNDDSGSDYAASVHGDDGHVFESESGVQNADYDSNIDPALMLMNDPVGQPYATMEDFQMVDELNAPYDIKGAIYDAMLNPGPPASTIPMIEEPELDLSETVFACELCDKHVRTVDDILRHGHLIHSYPCRQECVCAICKAFFDEDLNISSYAAIKLMTPDQLDAYKQSLDALDPAATMVAEQEVDSSSMQALEPALAAASKDSLGDFSFPAVNLDDVDDSGFQLDTDDQQPPLSFEEWLNKAEAGSA